MFYGVPSTDMFISEAMSKTTCKKHHALVDEPCYLLNDKRGICNARAKRAGYNHTISEKSKLYRGAKSETRRKSR